MRGAAARSVYHSKQLLAVDAAAVNTTLPSLKY